MTLKANSSELIKSILFICLIKPERGDKSVSAACKLF